MTSTPQGGPWTSLHLVRTIPVWSGKGRKTRYLSWPVADKEALYVSDEDGDTVRVHPRTLEILWRRPSATFDARFAVEEGVLVDSRHRAEIGLRRADSGELAWTSALSTIDPLWRGYVVATEGDSAIRAIQLLDPRTGKVSERIEIVKGADRLGARRGDVQICWVGSICRAFDLAERKVIWERDLANEIKARYPLEDYGRALHVFFGSMEGRFLATWHSSLFGGSVEDGSLLWRTRLPVPDYSFATHMGRFCCLSLGRVTGADEATGDILYDREHGQLEGGGSATVPAVRDERIAFPTEGGRIAVINMQDGGLAWFQAFKVRGLWGAADVDGRLFVTTGDGKLLVLEDE